MGAVIENMLNMIKKKIEKIRISKEMRRIVEEHAEVVYKKVGRIQARLALN